MKKAKKISSFWSSVFIVCIFSSICVFLLNIFLFTKKDTTSYETKQGILLSARDYLLINHTDSVNLETMNKKGYLEKDLNKSCDLKTSYVMYNDNKYFLYLNCNSRLESLILSY